MTERDRKRKDILDTLKTLWEMNPDLRFGQLIDAFSGTCTHSEACQKMFYMSNQDMLENLKRGIKQRIGDNYNYELSKRPEQKPIFYCRDCGEPTGALATRCNACIANGSDT